MPRHSARRDANEPEIVKALEAIGASVVRLDIKDGPDLLVGYRGRNILLEVKNPEYRGRTGHVKDGQKSWHSSWPGQAAIIYSAEEAISACIS